MFLTAFAGLTRAVPLKLGYGLADCLSDGHRLLSRSRREAVEGNLTVLGGDATRIPALSRSVFRSYGRFLFEYLRGPENPGLPVTFTRREIFDGALARGGGVVLAVPHLGNWDLAATRVATARSPLHAVAGVRLTPALTRVMKRRHEANHVHVVSPTPSGLRHLPDVLRANGIVALMVDGDQFRRGVPVRFCGRAIRFPSGPARLAAKSGAPIVPAFSVRRPDGGISIHFLDEIVVSEDTGESVREATARLAERLGEVVREHAGQWLIFRRFFPESEEGNGKEGVR